MCDDDFCGSCDVVADNDEMTKLLDDAKEAVGIFCDMPSLCLMEVPVISYRCETCDQFKPSKKGWTS